MSGTKSGGIKTAKILMEKDPLHYVKIGSKGGKNGKGTRKGFAYSEDTAKKAGAKGGSLSKRGYKYIRSDKDFHYYIEKATGEEARFFVGM